MRLPLIIAALTISAPAASEGPPLQSGAGNAQASPAVGSATRVNAVECRNTRTHFARGVSEWTGDRVQPRKLDELPGATAYMAAYRTINGCEVPLTVADYRNSSGR